MTATITTVMIMTAMIDNDDRDGGDQDRGDRGLHFHGAGVDRKYDGAKGRAELFEGEPAERLEKIGDRLKTLSDDYRPQAKTTNEIELVFSATDPFLEEFAEEELVIDRFAMMQSDLLTGRTLVRSSEGHELAALMTPLAAEAPASRESSETKEQHSDDHAELPAASIPIFVAAYDPVMPEPVTPEAELYHRADRAGLSPQRLSALRDVPTPLAEQDRPHHSGNDSRTGWPITAPDLSVVAAGLHDGDVASDDDLIIIEDDPTDPVPPTSPPVRRHEYRQLFARLRRG